MTPLPWPASASAAELRGLAATLPLTSGMRLSAERELFSRYEAHFGTACKVKLPYRDRHMQAVIAAQAYSLDALARTLTP